VALAGWCFAGGLVDPYSPLLCAPLLALLQALLMQLPFLLSALRPRWCAHSVDPRRLDVSSSTWCCCSLHHSVTNFT